MSARKRLMLYGGVALASEVTAVTLALIANGLGLVAIGAMLELVQPKR